MALLFTEGFDWSNTTADYITYGKWGDRAASIIGSTSTLLRFGASSGNYMSFGSSTGDFIRRPIGQNLASGIIGFAYRQSTSGTNLYRRNLVTLFDTTANVQCSLIQNNDLTLSVIRTSWANVLGTSSYTIPVDTWVYIEFKWKISDSIASGDVEVRVDETVVLTLAATSDTKNTGNAYATHYAFAGNSPTVTTSTGNTTTYIDDHYLVDLTGSVNNTYLGNIRIQTLFPNGNGNTNQWTGSDGNTVDNYLLVDDPTPNTTDYSESGTINDKDLYDFQDTQTTTSIVKGLTWNVIALKSDTGTRSIVPVIRHSGADYDGSTVNPNTTYTNHQQAYDTNPGTGSGWTKSDVDTAQFGAKVSA